MRRVSASLLMIAAAICWTGVGVAPGDRAVGLMVPAILFFGMGLYQFSKGAEDDRKSS